MSVHDACAWQLCREPVVHSSTLAQLVPLPDQPALHEHAKLPGMFTHEAWELQPCIEPVEHSLTSSQSTPFPDHPRLHAQVNDATVLVHDASLKQLSVPATHSFSSWQDTPVPL